MITALMAKLRPKPKIAILNAGIWENFFSDDTRTPINLAEALNRANITGIWKTTTFRNDTLPGRHRWTINRDSDPIMVSHYQAAICLDSIFYCVFLWTNNIHLIFAQVSSAEGLLKPVMDT